jgi:hypothetical protein
MTSGTTWAPIPGVRILGITGKARHGKDSIAKALLEVCPGAERWAFSDAVAVVARALHGMTTRHVGQLQQVGTDYRASVDAEVWLRCTYHAIEDRRPPLAIITGLRTPEDVDMVRQMGGTVVRVTRERAGAPFIATDRDPAHPIEQQIDRLHADLNVLIQDGNVEMIPRAARWVAEQIGLLAVPGTE